MENELKEELQKFAEEELERTWDTDYDDLLNLVIRGGEFIYEKITGVKIMEK